MSDWFDEYPVLVFGLELLVPLFLLIFIVVYVRSGKKKRTHDDRRQD